jgi:hypothetical protein
MPTYEHRNQNDPAEWAKREPGALTFLCQVKIVDPQTGEQIPNAFYVRTSPPRIGRFLTDADGQPLARATGRKIGGKRMDLRTVDGELIARDKVVSGKMGEYERWDVFEDRAWVAVSLATGEVVAKSEGVV